MAASRSTGSSVAPTDRPAAARRSSMTGSEAAPAAARHRPASRTASRRSRPGSAGRRPARRGPASRSSMRHRERARQLDLDPGRLDRRHRLEGRLERRRSRARTGSRRGRRPRAASTAAWSVNVRAGRAGASCSRRPTRHRRRRCAAADTSIASAAPARTADRPADARRTERSGGRAPACGCAGRRAAAHRGRSAAVRRRPARAACRSSARSTIRTQTSRERVAALGRHRREEADRGEARDRVDLGQHDPLAGRPGSRPARSPPPPIARYASRAILWSVARWRSVTSARVDVSDRPAVYFAA